MGDGWGNNNKASSTALLFVSPDAVIIEFSGATHSSCSPEIMVYKI